MKELKIFSDLTEATMARDFLLSRGIQATIDGAKNYSSHVVGGTFGRYVLRVEIDQFNDAQELLPKDKTENNKNKLSSEFKRDQQSFNRDSESVTQVQNLLPDYFRRSLFFAFASMVVLPIVFNVASLWAAIKFWQSSSQEASAKLRLGVLLVLQIPGFFIVLYLLREYLAN